MPARKNKTTKPTKSAAPKVKVQPATSNAGKSEALPIIADMQKTAKQCAAGHITIAQAALSMFTLAEVFLANHVAQRQVRNVYADQMIDLIVKAKLGPDAAESSINQTKSHLHGYVRRARIGDTKTGYTVATPQSFAGFRSKPKAKAAQPNKKSVTPQTVKLPETQTLLFKQLQTAIVEGNAKRGGVARNTAILESALKQILAGNTPKV